MKNDDTTQPAPGKRPVHVVRRRSLWDGDLVTILVPERAKVLSFKQGDEEFSYLAFRLHIHGDDFINVHVRPAGEELIGKKVKGWLSIWEKQLDDGRIYRYIDIDPVIGEDLKEPVNRWFRVVPNRPDEVEIREGWMFYNVPHPTKRGEILRGAILLFPPGEEIRLFRQVHKLVKDDPAEGDGVTRDKRWRKPRPNRDMGRVAEAHEREPVESATEAVETISRNAPVPASEPVRMGEVPRKLRRKGKPNAKASPATTPDEPAPEPKSQPLPQSDLDKLKELATGGFGMRSAFSDRGVSATE